MNDLSIELENFRLFSKKSLQIPEKLVITGGNGTGKTTILEALRVASVLKSFRSATFSEMIRFNERFLRLNIKESGDSIEYFYGRQFDNSPTERRLIFNKKEVALLDYLGRRPSVVFTPNDLMIVEGSPQYRRKSIDSVLYQTSREFRQTHLELVKVLKERSALLFQIKTNQRAQGELSVWNDLLNQKSATIRQFRANLINFLGEDLAKMEPFLSGKYSASFEYVSSGEITHDNLVKEIKLAQNLFGAHRDDINIFFNDRLAKSYASRGQARTLVTAMKILESKYLLNELKIKPVLLLDDIFSELDPDNSRLLISAIEENKAVVTAAIIPEALKKWERLELDGG